MVPDTGGAAAGERYERIRHILDEAAGTARPDNDGQRRFWDRSRAELAAATIYGIVMVAPAGTPSRVARSRLVVRLRGAWPFDGTQFPALQFS